MIPVRPTARLIAYGLLLAACGHASDGSPKPTSATVVAPPASALSVTTHSNTTDAQVPYLGRLAAVPYENAVIIEAARGGLVTACMATQGYTYTPPGVPESNFAAMDELYPADELVATYGYSWTSFGGGLSEIPPDPNANQDSEYLAAFDYCGSTVEARLDFSRFGAAQAVLAIAESQVVDAAVGLDSAVIAATLRWSTCMERTGYDFETPIEAQRSTSRDPTSDESIEVALRDFSCRRMAGLAEAERAASTRLTGDWIGSHPDALEELRNALAELTQRAKEVLATL